MMRYLTAYVTALLVFLLLDFLWLTVIAKDFYRTQLGTLMLTEPKLLPAALFYLIYVAGLVVFAVVPALQTQRWIMCAGYSAMLGVVAYATYDLSNLATLKGWSPTLTLVDIAWGALVTTLAGTAGYFAARWISR